MIKKIRAFCASQILVEVFIHIPLCILCGVWFGEAWHRATPNLERAFTYTVGGIPMAGFMWFGFTFIWLGLIGLWHVIQMVKEELQEIFVKKL